MELSHFIQPAAKMKHMNSSKLRTLYGFTVNSIPSTHMKIGNFTQTQYIIQKGFEENQNSNTTYMLELRRQSATHIEKEARQIP